MRRPAQSAAPRAPAPPPRGASAAGMLIERSVWPIRAQLHA